MPEIKFEPKYFLLGLVVILLLIGAIKLMPVVRHYLISEFGHQLVPETIEPSTSGLGASEPASTSEPVGTSKPVEAPAVGRPDVPYKEQDIQTGGSLVGTVIQAEDAGET